MTRKKLSREAATTWFWKAYPPGHVLELLPLPGPVPTATEPVEGWVMSGAHTLELREFLLRCYDLTGELFVGSLDSDSDLTEYVRGAVLAAYGRVDACGIRIVR